MPATHPYFTYRSAQAFVAVANKQWLSAMDAKVRHH